MSAWLILSARRLSPEDRGAFPAASLHLELVPGLAGAWTEIVEQREIVLFGYPRDSRNRWFQPFAITKNRDNALSLALRRIVHARQRRRIAILDASLTATTAHATQLYGDSVTVHPRPEGATINEFARTLAAEGDK